MSCLATLLVQTALFAQPYGQPDRDQPGNAMIQQFLRTETERIHAGFDHDLKSLDDWNKLRPQYKEEYLYMLGLWPLPERTPLNPTITGTLAGDGFNADMIHYQSRPGLYVTGNLYRPAKIKPGERLPAVFYVCGHSGRGRNGNKTAFQSHGIWFARHGYICLVVDTLQLGEIAAIHHGTYREGRWWWHSRGYTPAGVECWNGVRGIDYLTSRPDVDAGRIAVTGISGGGAATFWIAAADERVKAAVPVSGMADLLSYVPNRVINGHCDCMFLYNTFQWPWTRIAALIAPRPQFFVNSDKDAIFPMDANERVINRLERIYSLFGAGDLVDSLVSIGGHDYRQDIRQAAFRFINTHLKHDPTPVTDSEIDLVVDSRTNPQHPIPPEKLRVFPTDSDVPKDQLNTTIDRHFVPMATVRAPRDGEFDSWKRKLLTELRRVTFRNFPERVPPANLAEHTSSESARLQTEAGIEIRLRTLPSLKPPQEPARILLVVAASDSQEATPGWIRAILKEGDAVFVCDSRGVGETRWTRRDPPNYVARSHVLLGRTVEAGRVWDIAASARFLREKFGGKAPVHLLGEGSAAVLAAYGALLEPDIEGVTLLQPPLSHMESSAPALLNVLRVCDVPEVLGMFAPRSLTVRGTPLDSLRKVEAIYRAAGAAGKFMTQQQ
ncbi:MAG: prolyl oligopeptidase family serine peptidase [Verrucomicrobia bacterium]|nr:prolyl oligopeptidase family serine peptidase [Verrucomicrobiota bacterium]